MPVLEVNRTFIVLASQITTLYSGGSLRSIEVSSLWHLAYMILRAEGKRFVGESKDDEGSVTVERSRRFSPYL